VGRPEITEEGRGQEKWGEKGPIKEETNENFGF
jgi:hypothetical protein